MMNPSSTSSLVLLLACFALLPVFFGCISNAQQLVGSGTRPAGPCPPDLVARTLSSHRFSTTDPDEIDETIRDGAQAASDIFILIAELLDSSSSLGGVYVTQKKITDIRRKQSSIKTYSDWYCISSH